MVYRKWKNLSQINGENTRIYNLWLHARNRCTIGSRSQETGPTYKGCTLFKDWYDYDAFHEWVVSNKFYQSICRNGFYYQLDKDVLFKGNKIYSPSTCEFLPREINTFFTKRGACRGDTPIGVYRFEGGTYRAMISNPFTGKSEHLGLYQDPTNAFDKYREQKERSAKMFCDLYADKLSESVVTALQNYRVEITD